MMKQSGVPTFFFWSEAINTAFYIRNRNPTKAVEGDSPIKSWKGKMPLIKHLRPFGLRAYVFIKNKSNGNMDSRSEEYILVVYSEEAKAYHLCRCVSVI